MTNPTAISGNENLDNDNSPTSALIQFYKSFNHTDLMLMEQNWWHDDQVSMSNPLGGIKRGWNEIRQVYNRIFNGPAQVYVEFYDYSIHKTDEMFCAIGKERGYFRRGDLEIELAIRTSRAYILADDQWRQMHHHGSIDQPELLNAYQRAILNKDC